MTDTRQPASDAPSPYIVGKIQRALDAMLFAEMTLRSAGRLDAAAELHEAKESLARTVRRDNYEETA